MILSRIDQERYEAEFLAPYAVKSAESAGRVHREAPHPLRTDFQRDRARVIHSKAFRRLEYKTQVFLNGTGDHLRTRLTHTIEVASLSRAIARALRINEDLTETIALAHDLGHSPFGHSGEATLNRLMHDYGGFEHNRQSLRVVELIEKKYPRFRGINLTHEVREGLRKHSGGYPDPRTGRMHPSPSLEAQVANVADEIAYYSHDLDDGIDEGLIELNVLESLTLWNDAVRYVLKKQPRAKSGTLAAYAIRCLIDREVEDLLQSTADNIKRARIRTLADVRNHPRPLVAFSPAVRQGNRELRKFLYKNLYYNPRVRKVNNRACSMLKEVFCQFIRQPTLLPLEWRRLIPDHGLHRTVCDYLSGMTDRYLIQTHSALFPRG